MKLDSALLKAEGHLSAEAMVNFRRWLTEGTFAEFRSDILARIHQSAWKELEDEFYTTIPFGTGGRRGPRGLGPNRINHRTIAESAAGLANWVVHQGEEAMRRGIVIAFDTRHGSTEFSKVSAQAIAARGVQVFLFEGHRATPELSFAVRHLKAKAGIVISASHNPPSDNGFKAYAEDGGQILPPDDAVVMEEVQKAGAGPIAMMDFEEGMRRGIVKTVGTEVDRAYLKALSGVTLTHSRQVRLVYSPLHGVGASSVLPGLEMAGFLDVHVVEEQRSPNGDFPEVESQIPNPEVPSAMKQPMKLAEALDADLAIATDPDADRLGCAAPRGGKGGREWTILNGNQIGALLCYFVLDELHRQGRLERDGLVVKTVVTTDLIDRIAAHFGVGRVSELLVGFKYIGCVIKHLDDPDRFLFGAEESHGYLSRPYTRDKDGANAALLIAEMAARLKAEGRDIWWQLDQVHRRFGYFSDLLESYVRPGRSGEEEIGTMMRVLRENPPSSIGGFKVTRIVDRWTEKVHDLERGSVFPFGPIKDPKTEKAIEQLRFARDNLMVFHLGPHGDTKGGKIAIRPSGTEPKCKLYISLNSDIGNLAHGEVREKAKEKTDELARSVRDEILKIATDGIGSE